MKHTHWVIQAYDSLDGEKLMGVVEITILGALDEEDALQQVKKMIKRPLYRVAKLFECTACVIQKEASDLMKKQSKFLDKQIGKDDYLDELYKE